LTSFEQELKISVVGIKVEGNLFLRQGAEAVLVFALPALENMRVSLVRLRVPTAE
jgi:hypothetical protein